MNIYIKLFNIEWKTPYPLTNLKTVLDCVPRLFFLLQYVCCAVHLYTG